VLPEQKDIQDGAPPRKKQRGQNKKRPRDKRVASSERLCPSLKITVPCPFSTDCRFSHDIDGYMAQKPADIGEKCVIFEQYGECPYGLECRYGSKHISSDFKNIKHDNVKKSTGTFSWLTKELQDKLHKKAVMFPSSEKFLSKLQSAKDKALNSSDPATSDTEKCNKVGPVTEEDIIKPRIAEKKMVIMFECPYNYLVFTIYRLTLEGNATLLL